jgi:hypothetical protein
MDRHRYNAWNRTDTYSNQMKSLPDQISSLKREAKMRRKVYPRLIKYGRMTQDKMDLDLACTESTIETLEVLLANRQQDIFNQTQQ